MKFKIPQAYHRVSIKGVEFRGNKIMLVRDNTHEWELPGGGVEHGETIQACLRREIREEVGVSIKKISKYPIAAFTLNFKGPRLIVAYEVKLSSHKFTPSDECVDLKFFTKEQVRRLKIQPVVKREILELL